MERSTWRGRQRSYYKGKQKITWSIRVLVRLLKDESARKRGQNILKMVCVSVHRQVHVANHLAVFVNNHTAVWGSWYDLSSGVWGYACCQSATHISYCAGQAGIEAARASSAQQLLASSSNAGPSSSAAAEKASKPLAETHEEEPRDKIEQNYSKKRVGEGDVKLDNERLAKALQEEKKRKMRGEEDGDRFNKKKKGAPEGGNHEVTEEELGAVILSLISVNLLKRILSTEAYRMSRRQIEDPMANYIDTED